MTKIALTVSTVLLLLAASANAQQSSPTGSCTADELRLCSDIQPGRENLRACFREHIHELSDACLLALARLSSVDKTCRDQLNDKCANVEPGEGRLESCLREAAAKLDDYCKDALRSAIPDAGNPQ